MSCCSQCFSSLFLKEFNVGAVTRSIGELFQMLVPVILLQKNMLSDVIMCSMVRYLKCVTSCYCIIIIIIIIKQENDYSDVRQL